MAPGKLVLNRGLEVERGAIKEEDRDRLGQQRPARLTHLRAQTLDHGRVELVHHPVDLLKGKTHAEVLLEPAHAAPLAVGVGDACHHHVEQRVVRGPVARTRQQRAEAQQTVHLAVDLVDACAQALLLFVLLEIGREFLLAVPLASDADHLLGDLLGRKQQRLALVLQLRLDVLAELPQALVLVHGHADVAHDALSDLDAVAHGRDELNRASRAVGRGLDANEHGESVARGGDIHNQIYILGTTRRVDRTATSKSLSLLKTPDEKSARIQPNRRSQAHSPTTC